MTGTACMPGCTVQRMHGTAMSTAFHVEYAHTNVAVFSADL